MNLKAIGTWFLGFFCIHLVAVLLWPPLYLITKPETMWLENAIAAEEFLDKDFKPSVVIVGSSLARRLDEDIMGAYCFNLSFRGGSAETGLQLIRRKRNKPSVVVIESNLLDHSGDRDFVSEVTSPIKRLFPNSQARYRPTAFMIAIVRKIFPKIPKYFRPASLAKTWVKKILRLSDEANPLLQKVTPKATSMADEKSRLRFSRRLKRMKDGNITPVDSLIMDKAITNIRKNINLLLKDGVKVIFMEMPTHPKISSLPRPISIHQALLRAFPSSNYDWIYLRPSELDTSDGIHLKPAAARETTNLLIEALKKRSYWHAAEND